MTLHMPETSVDSTIAASIEEWEQGNPQMALVSCKERCVGQPIRSEFISEIEMGKKVVRCFGWKDVADIQFVDPPPPPPPFYFLSYQRLSQK